MIAAKPKHFILRMAIDGIKRRVTMFSPNCEKCGYPHFGWGVVWVSGSGLWRDVIKKGVEKHLHELNISSLQEANTWKECGRNDWGKALGDPKRKIPHYMNYGYVKNGKDYKFDSNGPLDYSDINMDELDYLYQKFERPLSDSFSWYLQ